MGKGFCGKRTEVAQLNEEEKVSPHLLGSSREIVPPLSASHWILSPQQLLLPHCEKSKSSTSPGRYEIQAPRS